MNCEICNGECILDNHHIHSLSLGGTNDRWNKCRICPNCHRKVHLGKIILEGRFASGKGNILIWRNKGDESITGMPDPPVYIL